ncbi:MAG TPA: NTP transferase domain-containing protein, partial [Candidatus Obscuribacterales bacterium]
MKAIILAAGRGSRMQGLSEAQPKCLTRLGDRPLLEWQLGALRQAGITETAVVKGYRGELLERPDLYGFENPRWAQTNMV